MLNYLDSKQQVNFKAPIRRKPNIDFGISFQTPRQFQKEHTMMSPHSFINPYLNYQSQRKTLVPKQKKQYINPQWTNKIDINQIQTQTTFLRNLNQLQKLRPQSRYLKQLSVSKTRFSLTKGQFTNFLQRNHSNEKFGPLIGEQRTLVKSKLTKKALMNKSFINLQNKLEQLRKYSSRKQKYVSVFDQKYDIAKNRVNFHKYFKQELQQRKTSRQGQFLLPKMRKSLPKQQEISLLNNQSIQKLQDLKECRVSMRYFTISKKH